MSALGRLTRSLRYAISVLTLLVIAAPCALGAAMGPVMRELGTANEHVCKCGMKPGKCGCPACDKLERERLAERAPSPVPVLKRDCDDDAPAMPLGAPLPAGVLAATAVAVLPVPAGDRLPVADGAAFVASADPEPPTPPPRIATV